MRRHDIRFFFFAVALISFGLAFDGRDYAASISAATAFWSLTLNHAVWLVNALLAVQVGPKSGAPVTPIVHFSLRTLGRNADSNQHDFRDHFNLPKPDPRDLVEWDRYDARLTCYSDEDWDWPPRQLKCETGEERRIMATQIPTVMALSQSRALQWRLILVGSRRIL
jgi:hypothetical protein